MYIYLDSIEKVLGFVRDIVKYEEEVDLVCGHAIVDAKSLMGIFSLDLRRPLEARVISTNVKQPGVEELLRKYAVVPMRKSA